MQYDIKDAVNYHYGNFPPKEIHYSTFINELLGATDALARYDQMLKNMHNNQILLARCVTERLCCHRVLKGR